MTQRLAIAIALFTGCAATPMDSQAPDHEALQLSPARTAQTGVVRVEADRATNTITAFDSAQHIAFTWAERPGTVDKQFSEYSTCLYTNYIVNDYDLETSDYVCAM